MAWCNIVKNGSNNIVKNNIIVENEWDALYRDVKVCKITKPFNKGGGDYGRNVIKDNDILLELYKKKNCWASCYASGESIHLYKGDNMSLRYEFKVKSIVGNTFVFTQSHLHYDGKMLVPFDTRGVLVVLY